MDEPKTGTEAAMAADDAERLRRKAAKRAELLALLAAVVAGKMDREDAHISAERMLLELLGDEEVTTAWDDARFAWWYA